MIVSQLRDQRVVLVSQVLSWLSSGCNYYLNQIWNSTSIWVRMGLLRKFNKNFAQMLLLKFIIDFTLFSKLWEGRNRLYLIWGDISLYINDCTLLNYILHILVGDLECWRKLVWMKTKLWSLQDSFYHLLSDEQLEKVHGYNYDHPGKNHVQFFLFIRQKLYDLHRTKDSLITHVPPGVY